MLGEIVVYSEYWQLQFTVFFHGAKADNASRSLFASTKDSWHQFSTACVKRINEVATIIESEIRLPNGPAPSARSCAACDNVAGISSASGLAPCAIFTSCWISILISDAGRAPAKALTSSK